MAYATWVILALVILAFFQYTAPERAHDLLDPVFSPVENFISFDNILNRNSDTDVCSGEYTPVCANGVTYDNACKAGRLGVTEYTAGVC